MQYINTPSDGETEMSKLTPISQKHPSNVLMSSETEMHFALILCRLNEAQGTLEHFANKYNEAVQDYNDLLQEAEDLRSEIVNEYPASDRDIGLVATAYNYNGCQSRAKEVQDFNQSAQEWVENWEDLDLDAINEIDEFEASHVTDLKDLIDPKSLL